MKSCGRWEHRLKEFMREQMHHRTVVKIGSGVLTVTQADNSLEIDRNTLYRIAGDIAQARKAGNEIIMVSSGATALGMEARCMRLRPESPSDLKALAAIGQGLLLALWRSAFAKHGLDIAQVLLTYSDFANRQRLLKVRETLDKLLSWDVIPIINENDSITNNEITLGDNDRLASQVAKLTTSTQLLILSSVSGVLDGDGNVIPQIESVDDIQRWVRPSQSRTGRGGMLSKLESAFAAVAGGIEVVIADGRKQNVIARAIHGQSVGTKLPPTNSKVLSARQHWIAYTLRCHGRVHIDAGAVDALLSEGASLLPVGITSIEGDFVAAQSIQIIAPDGRVVASGLAAQSSSAMRNDMGRRGAPAVHRDDLVINPREREIKR